jgi:ornithine cyclodeaminase
LPDDLWYLSHSDVSALLREIDPVEVAEQTLRAHAERRTVLPDEAYLSWCTPLGHSARSIAMPGCLYGTETLTGVKVINASLGNTGRDLPRASGLVILFDPETARPRCVLDAALISATRTAAVSAVAIGVFARPTSRSLAVIGCGQLAAAHLDLLLTRSEAIEWVRVYDLNRSAAEAFAAAQTARHGISLEVTSSAREAVAGAGIVILVTSLIGEGYLPSSWLAADAVVLHVSLDDLLPEVVLGADTLVVDDWGLVSTDTRRLIGRLHRAGQICGPGEQPGPGVRAVDGELADYLPGGTGVPAAGGLTVVNPFGMAIQDVALAGRIVDVARSAGRGRPLAQPARSGSQ